MCVCVCVCVVRVSVFSDLHVDGDMYMNVDIHASTDERGEVHMRAHAPAFLCCKRATSACRRCSALA